jgi:hypothetical protein
MARLCERPGCSVPAEVSYGFDADHLVVWLDVFGGMLSARSGVLCLRHANAMVVPLGWMLDDRREPVPRLFRSPATDEVPKRRIARQGRAQRATQDDTEQLLLDAALVATIVEDEPATELEVTVDVDPPVTVDGVQPWQPVFDQQDDLHGLLKTRDSLLARAFNGTPRNG